MKNIATKSLFTCASAIFCLFFITGCSHMTTGIGISFPLGPFGSIGVGVNSDGRLGASVGVGVGPAVVSVGTSGQLPSSSKEQAPTKAEPTAKPEEEKKP
jgi:hypothetical protein